MKSVTCLIKRVFNPIATLIAGMKKCRGTLWPNIWAGDGRNSTTDDVYRTVKIHTLAAFLAALKRFAHFNLGLSTVVKLRNIY